MLLLFPETRKDKEGQQNEGKMVICCKDEQILFPLTPQGHRNHSIASNPGPQRQEKHPVGLTLILNKSLSPCLSPYRQTAVYKFDFFSF